MDDNNHYTLKDLLVSTICTAIVSIAICYCITQISSCAKINNSIDIFRAKNAEQN